MLYLHSHSKYGLETQLKYLFYLYADFVIAQPCYLNINKSTTTYASTVSTSWSIELFVLPKELTNHEVLTARAYVVMLIFMFMFMQDHNISVDYELLYLLFCKSANFIFHCFFFGKILFNFLPGS